MIYPFLRRIAKRAGIYITTYTHRTGQSQSYPLGSADDKMRSAGNERSIGMSQTSKKRRFRHPLSIPDTQWRDDGETAVGDEDGDEMAMLSKRFNQTQGQYGVHKKMSLEAFRRDTGAAEAVVTSGNGSPESGTKGLGLGSLGSSLESEHGELSGIKVVRETIVERRDV